MSNPTPSPGNRPLDQLKVAELRDELKKRGLSQKGVKKDLLERLDEAVRKEQVDSGGDKELQGGDASVLPHYHSTVETSEDNDGMAYLNDAENAQDAPLTVDNASPYVEASDAAPVIMETQKDAEQSDSVPAKLEESKDDECAASGSALPGSDNICAEDDKVLPQVANLGSAGNPGTGGNEQIVEKAAESANEGTESEAAAQYSGDQGDGAGVTLPESGCQDSSSLGPLAEGPILNATACDPILESLNENIGAEHVDGALVMAAGDDLAGGDGAVMAQELSGAEVANISDVVIPPEGDKDVPSASVSDDVLNAADASGPAVDIVVNAKNDSPMQDVEVFERTVLTSVSVVPCVQESGKEPDVGGPKIGISEVTKEEHEETVTGKESDEAMEAISTAPEVPILGSRQESHLPESEGVHDITVQEQARDSVVQEEPQDIEMSEVHESVPMKLEVSETNPTTAVPEAFEHPAAIKSENIDIAAVDNTVYANESSRGGAEVERELNVKSEPMETELQLARTATPVENVKVEEQQIREKQVIKEEPSRNGGSFDRLQQRDYESDRSRRNSARAMDDRGRVEGRSGKCSKEEGRRETKETVFKSDEGADVRTGQKRKEDDRDAKQQEPAKRVRRWNSGNQPVVETAKPLTSGTVNEIVSAEVKREDFAVVPPKLTPKSSGPGRPMPAAAKSGSEANGEKRTVPPSTRALSASLKIERFVRPFTLKAVKNKLAEFGQYVDFWMDQIKTHCYVTYSKVDEAVAARNGLYNLQWPASFGNLLVADFVDPSEVKMRSDGSFEKMNAPVSTTPRGHPNELPVPGAQPSSHGYSNALASAPPLRERQPLQASVKEPEPPVPSLDDLFRKTKAKPHIYYLPLTDEQVAEKLAAAKNKEQLPARGRPLGRV